MLLPLAWLVRVNGSAEHRSWLTQVADGLLLRQAACGALREEVSADGWAGAARPPTNADYGTFEAPLNQENSDPVSERGSMQLVRLRPVANARRQPGSTQRVRCDATLAPLRPFANGR